MNADPKMMIHGEFVKREIGGDIILVPVGETALRFNGMITLTETASVLWDALEKGSTRKELTELLLEEFEIGEDTVRRDVEEFLITLRHNDLLVTETDK